MGDRSISFNIQTFGNNCKRITLAIHNEGSGLAGIYSYEIAEQRSLEAVSASRERGFPLQIKLEEE